MRYPHVAVVPMRVHATMTMIAATTIAAAIITATIAAVVDGCYGLIFKMLKVNILEKFANLLLNFSN